MATDIAMHSVEFGDVLDDNVVQDIDRRGEVVAMSCVYETDCEKFEGKMAMI